MADWYRKTEWSEVIAAEFETRLARSRTQKAQYLSLQGQALIATNPRVAVGLLERAVALNDEFETTRAAGYLAQARLALGEIDGALAAYEFALGAQLRQPNIVGGAAADYAFVIGWFERRDRLDAALPIVEAIPTVSVFGPDPQMLATRALVFDLAGRRGEARQAAEAALPHFDMLGDADALGISVSGLRERLADIVEAAA